MERSDFYFVVKSFLIWLVGLFIILFFADKFIPLQKNFLGGGFANYITNPVFWIWGNFDGEHYLSIVQNGYQPLTYFFFPFYPILTKLVSVILGSTLPRLLVSGVLVSLVSLALGLFGLYKLIKIDFKENIAKISLILILIFPTSFYFGTTYTESLFFALTVWFFIFARDKNYLAAGAVSGLATATRVVGIILPICLLTEMLINKENIFKLKNIISLIFSVSGAAIYMLYLKNATGSFLEFFNTVSIFGEQRESAFIFLPQVFYRYIFKILPSLNTGFLPVIFSTWLEFVSALIFLILSVLAFFKIRLSYAIYLSLGYIIPTFSGSFSSLPRYVLILFPAFILIAQLLSKKKPLLVVLGAVSFILLTISFALFARGYWIS